MRNEAESQVKVVVGGQAGDEGKGKIVDLLAQDVSMVIRANGGDNAGHTVVNGKGRFALHLIPAGVFNPHTINIIGPGVAFNPESFLKEEKYLNDKGIDTTNIRISEKAPLALPFHLKIDELQEEARGSNKIGTTKRGIGPVYVDRADRCELTAGLLRDPETFLTRLSPVLEAKRRFFRSLILTDELAGSLSELSKQKLERLADELRKVPDEFRTDYYKDKIKQWSERLADNIDDTDWFIQQYLKKGSNILVEGAQGTLLDNTHGVGKYKTSSGTTAAAMLHGAGVPTSVDAEIIGVFKAYATRVGEGPMPTELFDHRAALIRDKGGEYGATTGRPRRIGDFDKVAADYSDGLNGFTKIALTRLDILSNTGDPRICHQYKLNGRIIDYFPCDIDLLERCQPSYEQGDYYKDWQAELTDCRKFEDLPKEAQRYCRDIAGDKLWLVGVGAGRDEIIRV